MSGPVLVYGGTFDPVHEGHQQVAHTAADRLAAARVLLVPTGDPPHRERPEADGALRADWLRAAFAGEPRFEVDTRELHRAGRSFTIDTLTELRAELGPQQPLALLLGADAYLGLPQWERPAALVPLAHLVVFARPEVGFDPAAGEALGWQRVDDPGRLAERAAGHLLYLPDAVSAHASTRLRAALGAGEPHPPGLPAAVATRMAYCNPYRPARDPR